MPEPVSYLQLGMELMASSQSSATEREAQLIKPEDWSNLQKLFDEVKEEAEEGRKSAQELDPEQLQYRLCFKLKRFTLRLVKDESTFMNLTSLKWQLDLDVFDKAMQARVTAGAYSMEVRPIQTLLELATLLLCLSGAW